MAGWILLGRRPERRGTNDDRSIEDTTDLGWEQSSAVDEGLLTRIDGEAIERWHPTYRMDVAKAG